MESHIAALAGIIDHEAESPLGDVRTQSNRVIAPVSRGLQVAAKNLLDKAVRATLADDRSRALRYLERAAQLPFDDHEQDQPGWSAAHMVTFDAVVDALEASAEEDSSWLDVAEDILRGVDGYGRLTLLESLESIAQDFQVSPRESSRIATALRSLGPNSWLESQPAEVAEQVDAMLAAVEVAAAYQRARAGQAPPD